MSDQNLFPELALRVPLCTFQKVLGLSFDLASSLALSRTTHVCSWQCHCLLSQPKPMHHRIGATTGRGRSANCAHPPAARLQQGVTCSNGCWLAQRPVSLCRKLVTLQCKKAPAGCPSAPKNAALAREAAALAKPKTSSGGAGQRASRPVAQPVGVFCLGPLGILWLGQGCRAISLAMQAREFSSFGLRALSTVQGDKGP